MLSCYWTGLDKSDILSSDAAARAARAGEQDMSKETLLHLNTQQLIGDAAIRGTAWHYRLDLQGEEPNHYDGAIPVADVLRRLFSWHAIEVAGTMEVPMNLDSEDIDKTYINEAGHYVQSRPTGKKIIITDDTFEYLGDFKLGYKMHQYDEWLVETVAKILGGDLHITGAGLLANRCVAWVEVGVSETIKTPEGVEFRPLLLGSTSHNGSLATTFGRKINHTVCDNTLEANLRDTTQSIKIKHSRYSHLRLNDARQALAIIEQTAADFSAEVAELCSWSVSQTEWSALKDALVPVDAEQMTKKAVTMATTKRDQLESLWTVDERVAPWAGTAFGVLQAYNTYNQHIKAVRLTGRGERNQLDVLEGNSGKADAAVIEALTAVTGRELVNA